MAEACRIPLTVVGGFLGAGKTTVVNRILGGVTGIRAAVLVNDFGSVNIDAALVRDGSPAEVERVVEELLRYLTVVQVAFPRFAKQDLELYGCPVRKDDVIAVSLSGANRDPAWAGPDPERFDPHRPPSGGGHLAFGHGIHRCAGAELARMELRIVLPALFRRFPGLALAVPEEELAWRGLSFVYGVEELPVSF